MVPRGTLQRATGVIMVQSRIRANASYTSLSQPMSGSVPPPPAFLDSINTLSGRKRVLTPSEGLSPTSGGSCSPAAQPFSRRFIEEATYLFPFPLCLPASGRFLAGGHTPPPSKSRQHRLKAALSVACGFFFELAIMWVARAKPQVAFRGQFPLLSVVFSFPSRPAKEKSRSLLPLIVPWNPHSFPRCEPCNIFPPLRRDLLRKRRGSLGQSFSGC